ncbi:MAG: DUF4352 domain-containing protein [Acetatifactor sp.]|nr:DUF4352 domain-containing protein [Acetatifactor sp.]
MKKKLLTGLLLVAMLLNLAACVTVKDSDSQKTIKDIESSASDQSESLPNSESSEPDSNLPEYAKVGQIVSGDKWSIALLYAKEYDSIDSEYYSAKPSDGNKYLVLFFDVKNISSENDYFNSLYFEGYADDYSVNSKIIMVNPDGMSGIGGDIDAGKMSKGTMVYEVPSDWNEFEISYRDGLWTTHKAATFVVNKEDIASSDYTYPDSVYDKYVLDNSKVTEIGTEINSDTWSVKLLDVKNYDSIGGTFSQKPDDGKEFLVFFMEATNNSTEDDYFNYLYFRFYVDGYLESQSILLSDVDGYDSMSGDVAAGKKIKGYVAVQVPIGWSSAEVIYDDGTFTENKVAEFAVVNQ